MKRIIPIILLSILLFSCSVRPGRITYHLENAPFPHPERMQGHYYHDMYFSYEDHYSDNSVGVVVPDHYRKKNKVDLLIHFHGWGNSVDTCINRFKLAEQLNESGKNILLVVPEGPKFAKDSFDGKLCDEGGFQRFIDELLDSLVQDKIIRSPRIGRIILSGHSGGYYVMAHILRDGGYTDHISDVFVFDGLYGNEEDYMNWLRNYDGRLVDIYTKNGGTLDNSEVFMRQCDSLGIAYVSDSTKNITHMPKDRVLVLYSDLRHRDVIAVRHNLLKLLKSLK